MQATGTTHNNEKCNGTWLVLKICETKNNVWKRCELSIQNGIDNNIKITWIKPDSASLNKWYEPRNAGSSASLACFWSEVV